MQKEYFDFSLKGILIHWLLIPAVGGLIISAFAYYDSIIQGKFDKYLWDAFVSMNFWIVLSQGNALMLFILDRYWTWLEDPIKRLVASIFFLLVYSIIASLLVVYVYVELYFETDFWEVMESRGYLSMLAIPLGVTFGVTTIMHTRGFFLAWRREVVQVEKLKNENLSAKFESLKNQVNPHFLFNSLNALASLVHSDQDKAVDFIHKLSDVYRYVLDHQYDELVELKTELKLVEAFVFLNKIRFGDNLNVNLNGMDELEADYKLPPLTLQMLLENCLKHNEISKDYPLEVSMDIKSDKLTVCNNINAISEPKSDSNKLGLSNIIARYEFLTNDKVIVEHGEKEFCVTIPLLNVSNL